MLTIQVILKDADGKADHASGSIKIDIIRSANLVERNGRLYQFNRYTNETIASAIFIEVEAQPYKITEF